MASVLQAFPKSLDIPLTALILVVGFSASSCFVQGKAKLAPSTRKLLIALHAHAIEGTQLFLALCAFSHALDLVIYMRRASIALDTSTMLPLSNICLLCLAVYAVDLLEARICTGRWTHPYRWRPLVLTRAWMSGRLGPRASSGSHQSRRSKIRDRTSIPMQLKRARPLPRNRRFSILPAALAFRNAGRKAFVPGDALLCCAPREHDFGRCSRGLKTAVRRAVSMPALPSVVEVAVARGAPLPAEYLVQSPSPIHVGEDGA